MVEICCGSYEDAMNAYLGGAKRIELNSALYLGGCTPSLGSLILTKAHCPDLEVVCMVRPRGAGFMYNELEVDCMIEDAKQLLSNGADGIVFGFLHEDATIDQELTQFFVNLAHQYHATAIFHRAFDCLKNIDDIQILIDLGVDRILTSGSYNKAMEGKEVIKYLQENYGDQIEILAGSGINAGNAKELMEYTGINQVHSSCKELVEDPTTSTDKLSYAYGYGDQYDRVSKELVKELVESVK